MTDQAIQPERFGRQWLAFLSGLLLIGGLWWQNSRLPVHQPVQAPPANADWFLVLRMPAVTSQYESGIDTMRVRYGEWLDSLTHAGFHPMRLSEVYRLLQDGKHIPPKTVVLVFDPGYRRTYQIVQPILAQHNWPAVWITPAVEMNHGHREYVTYHQTRQMTESRWWDVGLLQKDGSVILQAQGQPDVRLGGTGAPTWSLTGGGMALNEGNRFVAMERLNVIADWTPQDLVNRVQVEVPIRKPVYLTLGQVQNLPWGVTTDADSTEEKHFDLSTPLHRHGTQVAWFGPRHYPDFRLDAETESLVGQVAVRMRWSELDDTGVIVVISNHDVIVKSKGDEHTLTVQELTRSGAGPRRPMKLALELRGRTLILSIDGRPARTVELPSKTPTQPGLLQLYLYDAVKGTAILNSMKMLFTPLS